MSVTTSPTTQSDPKRPGSLLSLDAGGPRGISQLLILKEVMEMLSKDENGDSQGPVDAGGPQGISPLLILKEVIENFPKDENEDSQGSVKRPCEVFDMIGGVGTGGLIAILLVVLKMTAQEALDEFSNFATEVFQDVAPDPKKQTEKLTRVVYGILERHGIAKDAKLVPANESAPMSKLVIPIIYKHHVGSPSILRNYTSGYEPSMDFSIAEAMLATCSSYPIFSPTTIFKDFSTFEYVSGDLWLSNPTREVISEACDAFENGNVSCILNLGCGHPGVNAVPNASSGNAWIDFVERVAMDSEMTAQDIGTQMSELGVYHRLPVNRGLDRTYVSISRPARL